MGDEDLLDRLRQRRRELDIAIAMIERELNIAPSDEPKSTTTASPKSPSASGKPVQMHTGSFLGMSTPKAVLRYLDMTKRAQNPREIADALKTGGQMHAQDAEAGYLNVYSALKRMRNIKVARTPEGTWGLIEWYGGRPPKAKAGKAEVEDGSGETDD